jgi:hypothetical protein
MKTKFIIILLLPLLILFSTQIFTNRLCLAADDSFKNTPMSKVRDAELSNKRAFTNVEGYTEADLWKYRISKILSNFQKCPAWIIWLFLSFWVCGWVYYMYRKMKSVKQNTSLKKAKEGMYVNMVGLALSLLVFTKTTDWTKNLLSGLNGVHSGVIVGTFGLTIALVCILCANLMWKIFKKFQS